MPRRGAESLNERGSKRINSGGVFGSKRLRKIRELGRIVGRRSRGQRDLTPEPEGMRQPLPLAPGRPQDREVPQEEQRRQPVGRGRYRWLEIEL